LAKHLGPPGPQLLASRRAALTRTGRSAPECVPRLLTDTAPWGAVRPKDLSTYLDEFVFRFNRRTCRSVVLPFERLRTIAAATPRLLHRQIVAP
jgi:hypothetical protein